MTTRIDDRLTTSEAARRAGVSGETLRGWLRSGRLPSTETRLGRLIDPADLERVIATRMVAGRASAGAPRAADGRGEEDGDEQLR